MKTARYRTIAAMLLAVGMLGLTRAYADVIIEDSEPGWTWSGMVECDDSQFHGGTSHAGGDGTYGIYTFKGTGVDVYTMGGPVVSVGGHRHRAGTMKVSLDGNIKAEVPLNRASSDYNIRAYTARGLTDGNHVLQIQPDGGWIVVDFITVQNSSALPPSNNYPTGHIGGLGPPNQTGTGQPGSPNQAAPDPDGLPAGKTVSLYAWNQKYASSDYKGNVLTAKSIYAGKSEQFQVTSLGGGYVTLMSLGTGQYVCSDPGVHDIDGFSGVPPPLVANRGVIDPSPTSGAAFHWEVDADGLVSLKSALNGLYVTVDATRGTHLYSSRTAAGEYEKFKIRVF